MRLDALLLLAWHPVTKVCSRQISDHPWSAFPYTGVRIHEIGTHGRLARVGSTYLPPGLTGPRLVAAVTEHVRARTQPGYVLRSWVYYFGDPIVTAAVGIMAARFLDVFGGYAKPFAGALLVACVVVLLARIATWPLTGGHITGRADHAQEWLEQKGRRVDDVETADLLLEHFDELTPYLSPGRRALVHQELLELAEDGTSEEIEAAQLLMHRDLLEHRQLEQHAREQRRLREVEWAKARVDAALPEVQARLGLPAVRWIEPVVFPAAGPGDIQDEIPGASS